MDKNSKNQEKNNNEIIKKKILLKGRNKNILRENKKLNEITS